MRGRLLLLFLLVALGSAPMLLFPDWHGTEGRRVQIAYEVVQNGDWLVPTLGFEPTWAKPPLHYWLLGAMSLLGHEYWLLRLPAVLGVFAAAWLAQRLLQPWFGAAAGWTAAFGIALSPIVLVEWPSAEIDPTFASLTAMSLWCLATGVARERVGIVFASGVLGGLALLDKGPPYFLFAIGAYLVWWRHRRFRFALAHFVPMLLVPLFYAVPLFLLRVRPGEMLGVANDETVGRLFTYEWHHFTSIPEFWVRAVAIQLPFVLWCFWEWRGERDARMSAGDLTLRMCSGAAVLAIVLLTLFPGRPTRYILPNALLFTFAVAPAVAHYAAQIGGLGQFARRAVRGIGLLGALGLIVVPFVPEAGFAALGLCLVLAISPTWVTTPRRVVTLCLLVPLVASLTVVAERSLLWLDQPRARIAAGRLLRGELDARGANADLETRGHVDSPLLLAAGRLLRGDEALRKEPTSRWLLHEARRDPADEAVREQLRIPIEYAERLRLCLVDKVFVLRERAPVPR